MSVNNPQSTGSNKTCTACGRRFKGDLTVCPDDNMPLMTLPDEDLVGTVLENKYEILEKIGAGGMGAVYKARHQLMHRQVAIKMVLAQLSANSMTLKRFTQEARATSQLNHPNILTVFDFGISPSNQPYLVMDFLEGVNFGRVLEETRQIPIPRAIGIFLQVCAALGHAHQKGIVHRDLKPSNIMLIELDGQPDFVKVLDFGIAKVLSSVDGETDNLTRTGEVFGSPLYMSPEQFRGKSMDARSDIYSLGCVMYRSLAGICPVTGKDVLECMYKHVNESIPPFSVTCPEAQIPERLETIIMKALAKDPDERYASMNDLRADLEMCAEELALGPLGPAFLRSGNFTASDPALMAFPSGTYRSVGLNTPAANTTSSSMHTHVDHQGLTPGSPHAAAEAAVQAAAQAQDAALNRTSSQILPPGGAIGDIEVPVWVTGPQSIPQPESSTVGNVTGSISISGPVVPAEQVRNLDSGGSPQNQLVITYSHPQVHEKASFDMRIVAAGAAVVLLAVGGLIWSQVGNTNKSTQPHIVANPHTFEDFTSSGLTHYSEGRYADAVAELKKANALARSFPESDKRKLDSWINLGEAQVANDDYKEAESCLNHAAMILSSEKQTKGKEYARVQQDLGEMRLNSGDYDAAEPCFKTALGIRMNLSGTEKEDAADSLQGLASISIQRRNYQDAIAKLQQAQKLIEANSGKEDRDYVAVITDLARAEQMAALAVNKLDQLPKIASIYEDALKLSNKAFPPDHPQIGKINLAYATLLFRQGKMADAENRFNEAIRITTINGGEKSVDMAQMKASLALLYVNQKRYGAAEQLFADAITIGTRKLGETNDAVRRWKSYRAQCEKQRRRG
ncbi:MAG: protein kinase [Candidatus Melainabacteria bacterium]|nr:protein kinase [Candidatus Melainabacteria bacterium]